MTQLIVNMSKFTVTKKTNDEITGVYSGQGISGTPVFFNAEGFFNEWKNDYVKAVKKLNKCDEYIIDLSTLHPNTQAELIKKHKLK